MKSRRPDRINEEMVSIDSLVQHLRRIYSNSDVNAYPESQDPPDYWLRIGEIKFAVEITSITGDEAHAALSQAWFECLKRSYQSDPIPGTYQFIVSGRPSMPKRGSVEWNKLVVEALDRIRSISTAAAGTGVKFSRGENGYIALRKGSNIGNSISRVFAPGVKWEGEVEKELAQLLEVAVAKKLKKLQKKGVMNDCPNVILALYDAYA